MERAKRDSGQVALILVLLVTIVGTAAVSLAGRQVVETRVQEVNVDSSQALLAAEAGLEQAIQSGAGTSGALAGTNATFDVSQQTTGENSAIIGPLKNGEVWEINLSGAAGGTINLFWEATPGSSGPRGLYVGVVSPTGVADYAIGPTGSDELSGFDSSGITTNQSLLSRVFDYKRSVTYTPGTSTVMRVMALGGDTDLGFQAAGAGAALTAQITQLTSVGTVTRGDEAIKQGLGYYESVADQVPAVFDYTLYSGTTISQ